MVEIRDEFEVSTRSSIFPESNRLGSLTMFVNPNSPIISMSLFCLAAVCELVEHIPASIIYGTHMCPFLVSIWGLYGNHHGAQMGFANDIGIGPAWVQIWARMGPFCDNMGPIWVTIMGPYGLCK